MSPLDHQCQVKFHRRKHSKQRFLIQHSEFILVREGELEFQHESAAGVVSEKVGPGGVFYVAFGTRHTGKNVGGVPAQHFVVAIGGDAK